MAFDRLIPACACAGADPLPWLRRRKKRPHAPFTDRDFTRATTSTATGWAGENAARPETLILQGVPGTGKTHVARALARLLTAAAMTPSAWFQFHPAYSYENLSKEFGPRALSQRPARRDLPVEDGLLCRVRGGSGAAAQQNRTSADRRDQPRQSSADLRRTAVLLDTGNQTVGLPYSRAISICRRICI